MKNRISGGTRNDLLSRAVVYMNAVGCVWTAILMMLTVIDVCGRYFFNRPLTGTPEIIQASIVGITFLQIPYVQLIDQHLAVTVVYDKMSSGIKKGIDVVGRLLGSFVFGLIVYSGWNALVQSIRAGEYDGSPASIMLPTWPVRSLIVFCSVIMIILQIRQIILLFRKKSEV